MRASLLEPTIDAEKQSLQWGAIAMHRLPGVRRFIVANARTIGFATGVALLSSSTAAAASYLVLATTNTAGATTTLQSGVNAATLQIKNTNSAGGTSAKGINIVVPSGRPPIVVNSSAGKATNLNADKLDGIDSSGFIRGPVSPWRAIGAAGQPQFTPWCPSPGSCSPIWSNLGGGHNTAGFYKDPLGIVRLKGVVRTSLGGGTFACHSIVIVTLPAGYRPAAIVIAPTLWNDRVARIDIAPSGDVSVCSPNAWSNGDWFSLDGITFRAAQ